MPPPNVPGEFDDLVSEQLLIYRGMLLTSFANVEWWLAELIEKFSTNRRYAGMQLDFSIKVEKRLQRLQSMLKIEDGPLARYRDEMGPLLATIESYEDFRNFMAHGVTVVKYDNVTNPNLIFRMYKMFAGGELMSGTLPTDLEALGDAAIKIGQTSRNFTLLIRRIWRENELPPAG